MRRPLLAFVILLSVALSWAAAADATEVAQTPERHMEVVQVQGAIDPVVADLIKGSIRRAQTNGATVVILQIDSRGALDTDASALIDAVRRSKVPVAVWVGPKSTARGAAAGLVAAASFSAAAPGAGLGPVNPLRLDPTAPWRASVDYIATSEDPVEVRFTRRVNGLANRRVRGQAAADEGLVDVVAPTLGDLIVALNGKEVPTAAGPVRLTTAKQVDTKEGPRQTADQPVRFLKPGTFESVQHSLTSPSVVFLLLIVGLSLMVFEFFTVGIGLAGATGAAAVAGALYGCSHLPVTWWALGLLVISTFGFAVDVQAGHQGFWTGVGVVGLLAGALKLFGGSSALDVPLWLVVLIFVGQIIFMLGGMTVAVRNRFSIPTVGRDSMIGELGEARTELNPDGVVTVRGAPWRARTHRGTPVSPGGAVRVVAVDRLV
ncbi:MAG TPA: NfeD family protein, partial [Acidimicrobiia bacterium]|nr:NfeD family protein [Acidimicrobiia bacterium]